MGELVDPVLPERGWYVGYAKPRLELQACGHLRAQGYQVFLPELTRWARVAGQWQRKAQAMFPRYLFLRPAHPQQAIGPAQYTSGMSCLVRFGMAMAMLSNDQVAALQALCADLAARHPESPFVKGAPVVFSGGPLKGAAGIVSAVAQERVSVLLSLLGHQHEVKACASDLAAA